ncbi:MAG: outer membrane lipoprotein carrier protein LolA [Pseudomonadota bacterium]
MSKSRSLDLAGPVITRRGLLAGIGGVGLIGGLAPLIGQAQAATPLQLSDTDRRVVDQVESFLNRLTTVRARFVQSASNGSYAEGMVYVERPSRMRFDYDPPVPMLIVADGYAVALYDRELKQVTQLPIWETPLWFLFKEPIQLDRSLVLTYLAYGQGSIVMTIQEEQAEGNLASVTLTFTEDPISLRKWEVVDPQGVIVQTGLINPEYGVRLEEDLFDLRELDVFKFQGTPQR